MLDRANALERAISGMISSDDPERLHAARVASRRLAAAIDLFAGLTGASDAVGFSKLVKSVTKMLGNARDLDVRIEWIHGFAGMCAAKERPGARRIELRLAQKRARVRPLVARGASGFAEKSAFKATLAELMEKRIDIESGTCAQEGGARERAARAMIYQIDHVARLSGSLSSARARDEHHRLRIGIKRLRYFMEMANGLSADPLDAHIEFAKKIQGALGELHDANVWIESTPKMKAREIERTERYFGTHRPFSRLAPGFDAVIRDREAFWSDQYAKTRALWDKADEEGKLRGLRELFLDACRNPQDA
ncbi:MAG: CHAD domain-containing protein [Synergistaceae bacterium]|nr:CHAD domain-containing protein [Synergistaceae bacterium]